MCEVSVIIPYYNSKETIIRALKSVINQTYKDLEIILIDDGSIDDSHKIVDEFIKFNLKYKIMNLYQKNSGPSKARNEGIKNSKGEYIAFLDSDDEWLPQKLSEQLNIIKKHNADLVGCNYNIMLKNTKIRKFITKETVKQVSFFCCLFRNFFVPSTTIISKRALFDIGLFPENQRFMEDAYVFKLINRKYDCYVLGNNLVNFYKYLYGYSGLSSCLGEMEKYEILNFKHFRKENYKYKKKINLLLYVMIISFSYLKYLRRVLIVKVRR